ncbi:MAG: hypothetical protein V7L01_07740 [Nostoc sp.]|uniref:hypothetical protein n=1 Tax=Nostoc sp. TaxID=1180 RepID=UPI002FF5FF22
MTYCNTGDKPKVTYRFNNGSPVDVQMQSGPIDVQTGTAPNDHTSNYNGDGYQITFNSPQALNGTISLTVVDYKVDYVNKGEFDSGTGYYLQYIGCGDTKFPTLSSGVNGIKMSSPNVNINASAKCPVPNKDDEKCEIKILSDGAVLFRAEGECPVSFTVACNRCPVGTCECKSDSYPGYCCNDCASTASKLRAIASELRSKNGG